MLVRPPSGGNEGIKEFLKQKNVAVAGSFRSREKVAYRILLKLKAAGRNVYPVNPSLGVVEGLACSASVSGITSKIDAIDIVTPPAVTEKIVLECIKRNIKNVWLQPGAESEKAMDDCRNNGINVIYGACLLVELED